MTESDVGPNSKFQYNYGKNNFLVIAYNLLSMIIVKHTKKYLKIIVWKSPQYSPCMNRNNCLCYAVIGRHQVVQMCAHAVTHKISRFSESDKGGEWVKVFWSYGSYRTISALGPRSRFSSLKYNICSCYVRCLRSRVLKDLWVFSVKKVRVESVTCLAL